MLVPRVVQLRAHYQLQSSLPVAPLSPVAPARPMASPAVDQLVADYLRIQGFVKTLKAFVAEASYKEPKVSTSEDLATICSEYFASKKVVAVKTRSGANGSVLKPKVKTDAKSKPESSSSDDSDDSSDESDDEETKVAPAPVLQKAVAAVPAVKAKVESSSSDDSSSEDEEEDVIPVQTGVKVNAVEKEKTKAAASESSSSDSDDEEEAAPTTSKPKVALTSKKEESSSDDSDDESEDEKVVAKTPPPALSKGKKSVVPAGVTPKPASSSSSDSSSDDEEVVVGQSEVKAAEPAKPADDSSEEDSDVEMKSVTPAVVDKKSGKPSLYSDSSDSSDDEMEVDTKPPTLVKETRKSTVPKVEVKKAASSSSDSSSDEDSDDEASDKAKNVVKPAAMKPVLAKEAAPSSSSDSSSSDSSSDEEEGPKAEAKNVGANNITSAKKVVADSDAESDSSDESVEIKSTVKRSAAAAAIGKQASSDSSDSSDDEEAKVVTKPAGKKTLTSLSKPAEVVKDKKSAVTKGKQATPEPAVEKLKVKKAKKSSQETISKAEDAQVVVAEVPATPVNKKRKAEDDAADAAHVIKKANVDGVAVATANDDDKSAQKWKQGSATKTPSSARAFQRVKVEEVQLLDERLGDNSYWAKSGAEEGWGAKAQEVLGQVRGKGFRHEKTKKKRGSYKGGIIDNASHSIKFENSDDE